MKHVLTSKRIKKTGQEMRLRKCLICKHIFLQCNIKHNVQLVYEFRRGDADIQNKKRYTEDVGLHTKPKRFFFSETPVTNLHYFSNRYEQFYTEIRRVAIKMFSVHRK